MSPTRAPSRALASVIVGTNVALAGAAVALQVINRDVDLRRAFIDPDYGFWVIQVVSALVWSVPGFVMARRRPDLPFGWLALAVGLSHGLSGAGFQWAVAGTLGGHDLPATGWAFWLADWTPPVEVAALGVTYLLLPYGRRPRGWLGTVGTVAVTLEWVAILVGALLPLSSEGIVPESPLAHLRGPVNVDLPGSTVFVLLPVSALVMGVVVVLRWWRAEGEERQMLRWLAGLVALGPIIVAGLFLLPWGAALAQVTTYLEVASISAVVLRYRLFGVEVAFNRAILYTALTAVLGGIYAVVVAGANAILSGNGASFAGAMAAAFAFSPVRTRVQLAVNRFMYGKRDDPYAVVSDVSRQLAAATSPDQLLSGVVQSVAEALRLPYVAIRLTAEEPPIVIEAGTPPASAATEHLALRHQGQPVGELVAAVRAGETEFRPNERRLLEQLAEQAGVAAGAASLTLALRRSRERLVVAREEERRRLRRDLHDGLGPTLTASAFTIDTARNILDADPHAADRLLAGVRTEIAAAIDDIRRLVYGLRPPALDELGLIGALRQHIARLDGSPAGLTVLVDAPEPLPALPAAVEVAAFRIATEAVTNVARHSNARTCTVRIACSGDLQVDVRDDGSRSGEWTAGVGTISMKERAAEVGGVCDVGPAGDGGGRVSARLPLHVA